jgi:excinuclease ABC subunit C
MLLLQRVRDESHRFAIEYQRDLRSKVNMTSILEELPGIGPGKRKALLKALGSLRAVRNATLDELIEVPGVSARDAASIHRFFDALTAPEVVAEADEPDDMEGLDKTKGPGGMEEAATEVAPQPDEESVREMSTPDGKGVA